MASLAQIANFSFIPAPWRWLPVLIVTGIGIDLFSTVTLWVAPLFIPIAALLGSRYGRQGFAVAALGGLPLLLQWRYAALFGGALDLYFATLIVCKLAGSPWPKGFTLQPPTNVTCLLAFLLLPLSFRFFSYEEGDFTWLFDLVFDALLYLFVFLLGTIGFSGWRIGAMLTGFTIFGMVLELLRLPQNAQELFGGPYAELPLLGYTELRSLRMEYGLDSPAQLFTVLGWFFAGRQVISLNAAGDVPARPWHRTWLPVVLLALVGVGWETNAYLITLVTGNEINLVTNNQPLRVFMLLGSFYALSCAAFWAGLLLRWRGIWLVLALLAAFLVLDSLISAGFDVLDMRFAFYSDGPAAVLGFGMLGIGLRNRLLGTNDILWSWQWTSYIAIVAVMLPILFSLESLLDLLWMIVSGIGAVVAGKWLALLRKRYFGWLPEHGGWLALLWLLAFISIVIVGLDPITQMAASAREWLVSVADNLRAGEGWYEPDGNEFMAMLVLCGGLVLFFSILKRFLVDAPSCWRDLRALIGVVKGRNKSSVQDTSSLSKQHFADSGWSRIASRAATSIAFARNATAVMLTGFVLIQAVLMFYPRDGMFAMVKEWFVPEEYEFSDFDDGTLAAEPVNPYLWQAVSEAYAQLPGTMNEREGSFATDWYSDAGNPGERRRLTIRVGELLESYELSVSLRLQKKGLFGIWVEQASYWDPDLRDFAGTDPYTQQREIEERLMARARQLADADTN